jgi:hypothetical protein
MKHITLTDEQARVLAAAQGEVELRDASGEVVAHATCGFTKEDIEEALRLRDSDDPYYTTDQVLAHLQSLETE